MAYSAPLPRPSSVEIPSALDEELQFEPVELAVQPTEITIPNLQDAAVAAMNLNSGEREAYYSAYRLWNPEVQKQIHRVGGYPDCVQGDPKVRAQLVFHGIDCGKSAGHEEGKRRGLLPGASDWELLLQVDTDERARMTWRDQGRIYFLIRKDDLAKRRFDGTRVVLQSR